MRKGSVVFQAIALAGATLYGFPDPAAAQTELPLSIEVKPYSVVVPVSVWDRHLASQPVPPGIAPCMSANGRAFRKLTLSQPYLPQQCALGAIDGLTTQDFHVFVDGVEQKIQSVSPQYGTWEWARDTLGFHHEWSYTPVGRWSAGDMALSGAEEPTGIFPRYYLVEFAPPESAQGSCHQLKVLVDSPKAAVSVPDQYCNIKDAASDPLYGTALGRAMENGAPSSKKPRLPLSLQAAFFYTGTNQARVDIAVEWPLRSYLDTNKVEFVVFSGSHYKDMNPIGVLGMVYKEGRVLARRFSDLGFDRGQTSPAPAYTVLRVGPPTVLAGSRPIVGGGYDVAGPSDQGAWNVGNLPIRYEAQIDLPSGEYDIVVALGDEKNFGQAGQQLKIDSYDGTQLALSSVVLSKRGRDAAVAAQEAAAAHLAPKYVPLVSKGVQVTPAADRRFRRGEPLVTYFEIYEPLLLTAPATTVWAHLRLVDAKRGAVKEDYPPMNVAPYIQPGSSVIPVTVSLKARKGAYRLEVQATDSAGRTTPWRAANFTIE
jgi:hypothetical protein